MRSDSEILIIIDEAIKSIWVNEIQKDYNENWFMNEDTLKNALYFHLRSRLEKLLSKNDLRIFTEFNDAEFSKSGFRPDMVIAYVDMNSDADCWRQAVTKSLAVIELKLKSTFADKETIYADYTKLEKYIDLLGTDCKMYMATIWECEDDQTTWIRKNAAWAKGRVTELNASWSWGNCKPQFYIKEHK